MTVLNIRKMPEELVHRLKLEAVKRRTTMREIVIEALEKILPKEEPKRGTASRK